MDDKIKINFQYIKKIHFFTMSSFDTIKNLKDYLETSIDFNLSEFKILYQKNNLHFINPSTKLKDYFTGQSEVFLDIIPKAFMEKKHLKNFEDGFNEKTIREEDVISDYHPRIQPIDKSIEPIIEGNSHPFKSKFPENSRSLNNIDNTLKENKQDENRDNDYTDKENDKIKTIKNYEVEKDSIPIYQKKKENITKDSLDHSKTFKSNEELNKIDNFKEVQAFERKDEAIKKNKTKEDQKNLINKEDQHKQENMKKVLKTQYKSIINNSNLLIENNDSKDNNPKGIGSILSQLEPINRNTSDYIRGKTYFCNMDLKNFATYICTKCKKFWCDYCMKFEVHKVNLVQLKYFDNYCLLARDKLKKDLETEVKKDDFYPNIDKIDFALNDKIEIIDDQFNQMANILEKIKENQNKYLVNLYYRQIQNNNFKDIKNDVKTYENKIKELENTYQKISYEANIDNINFLNSYKVEISKIFNEFKQRYNTFNVIVEQFDRFNLNLINQLESKVFQNNDIKIDIGDVEKMSNGIKQINSINNNITNSGNKHPLLLKINYYNKMTCYDHFKGTNEKLSDFKDKCNFKMNYKIYCGNIYLNLEHKLFIVTGQNYNLFFFYDLTTNEIFRLSDLSFNHCRGSLIFIKKINSIICISGKNNNKCEIFNLDHITFPSKEDNISFPSINNVDNDTNKKSNAFFNKIDNTSVARSNKSRPVDNSTTKWGEIPELNFQRHYSTVYIFNDQFIYILFGINNSKGSLASIERIEISSLTKWELVKYQNTHNLDLHIDSAGAIFASNDEVYIVGGCVNERYCDKILKFNFINNNIFKTDMIIPYLKDNEYYRFWEESTFKHLTNFNKDFNDDDFSYAMFDAKDKIHIFNPRTYKYTII